MAKKTKKTTASKTTKTTKAAKKTATDGKKRKINERACQRAC
jgi:hypothetical protein